MELEEELEYYNKAINELFNMRKACEMQTAMIILGESDDVLPETLDIMDGLDRAEERLNNAVKRVKREMCDVHFKKIKPENCKNSVLNGGGCKTRNAQKCDDCFECKEEV